MPYQMEEGFLLEMREDYLALLGDLLMEPFTAKEFGRALKMRGLAVSRSLKALERAGAVQHTGSRGRAFVYERTDL